MSDLKINCLHLDFSGYVSTKSLAIAFQVT